MFDYIKIEGFRSFKRVELEMPPLAVLMVRMGREVELPRLLTLMTEAGDGKFANGVFKRGGFPSIAFGFDPSREVHIELRFKEVMPRGSRASATARRQGLDVIFKMAARNYGSVRMFTEELVRQSRLWSHLLSADIVSRGPQGRFSGSGESGAVADQRREVSPTELAISRQGSHQVSCASACWRNSEDGPSIATSTWDQSPRYVSPRYFRPASTPAKRQQPFLGVLRNPNRTPGRLGEILENREHCVPGFRELSVPAGGGDGKVLLRWFERPYEKEGVSANLLSDGHT